MSTVPEAEEEVGPAVGDDGVYEVDRVVDVMWMSEGMMDEGGPGDDEPRYRVRWKGFPPIEDTWEPISNFTPETRRTVRKFVRRYRKMQLKESQLQKELGRGQAGGGLCRHVNILSKELLRINSMRCDRTRQPPLWFYLVVWRGERVEDATWESEVYLQHAADLIQQYRARHPQRSPVTPVDSSRRGLAQTVSPAGGAAPTRLLLDGPAPRKQKEKLVFVDNLIDDTVSGTAPKFMAKVKPRQGHGATDSSTSGSKTKLHKFDEDIMKSSGSARKSKESSTTRPIEKTTLSKCLDKSSSSVAEDKLKKTTASTSGKKDISVGTGKTSESSTGKGSSNSSAQQQSNSKQKGFSSSSSSSSSSKDRFKRIMVKSDTSDSESDDLAAYKAKFIKDEKLEEKKRRALLMKERKTTKPVKKDKKPNLQPSRQQQKDPLSERPFKEKEKNDSMDVLPDIEGGMQHMEELNNRSPSEAKYTTEVNFPRAKEFTPEQKCLVPKTPRSRDLIEKLCNIFGYDTDSEDLTLSPESYCSSVEKTTLHGDCSDFEISSSSESINMTDESPQKLQTVRKRCKSESDLAGQAKGKSHAASSSKCSRTTDSPRDELVKKSKSKKERLAEALASVEKIRSRTPQKQSSSRKTPDSNSSSLSRRNPREVKTSSPTGESLSCSFKDWSSLSDDSEDDPFWDLEGGRDSSSSSFLSDLAEYDPEAARDQFKAELDRQEPVTEEDFLAAVYDGNYSSALRFLEQRQSQPQPALPYNKLLADAVQGGRGAMAQLLATCLWRTGPPHHRDQVWGPVVELAAQHGDLCLLMVIAQLYSQASSYSAANVSDEEENHCSSRDPVEHDLFSTSPPTAASGTSSSKSSSSKSSEAPSSPGSKKGMETAKKRKRSSRDASCRFTVVQKVAVSAARRASQHHVVRAIHENKLSFGSPGHHQHA